MSTTVNVGWLKDSQGNKFAPKTVSSQVMTSDGITLEEYINVELVELENAIAVKVDDEHTHEITDITNLQENLDIKANAVGVAYIDTNDTETEVDGLISNHSHNSSDIISGTLSVDILPIVPVNNGGTGATNVETARANLGVPSVEEMNDAFNALKTEKWTFILEDGYTITKEVYVV